MVYQFQPATYGDIRQDCRTPRSRYKRTVEDREKQVIVLKGRWCIPLSGKTVRKTSMDKITSRPIQCFKKGDAFVEMAPRPLVFMEVNEVKDSQSYTNENGGKTGGKDGGENEGNVPVIELTERQRVILELISIDSTLSAKALSEKMSEKMSEKSSVNERTIERDIAKLKKLDYLRRIGGRKDGHWEVNIPLNSIVEIV